ncbi:unnamed protein product [Adineta ricciae]|uniref:Uncharacterized protein n=1 Tax=Adineta ricciae TaxID=249248 RepID=A0A815PE75_ADIRI|nr:unnamed protein product [Adineta ricciae]
MASARNLCQHSDSDGTQCTSHDYTLCPHCQLQLCLKHLNSHQELLRTDLHELCDKINCTRMNFDDLRFDSTNHREFLFKQLDDWYDEQLSLINKTYAEKKQEIQILCLKSQMEFDLYKLKKEKQLKMNLMKQLKKVLMLKQVHVDDLNEMRNKLEYIQRGIDELKQLKVDIYFNSTNFDISIIKRRYVEAAKPLFNDDDDNLWKTDSEDEEESDDCHQYNDSCGCKQNFSSSSLLSISPAITVKKPPLKLVIKRLRHSTISNEIKYKLHAINTSLPIRT